MKFECLYCKQEHSVQKEGFVIIRFIQDMLKIKSNSIDMNQVFEEFNIEIRLANETVDETDRVAQESESKNKK